MKDCRSLDIGYGYDARYLVLKEVATKKGGAYLAASKDKADGPIKWVLGGDLTPTDIDAWMKMWKNDVSLTGIYGVPSRGYAGCYRNEL